MDLRYLNYCQPGNPFYDVAATATADATAFPAVTGPLPEGWTRTDNTHWLLMTPPGARLPGQGWKIHVSATLDNADRILDLVWDFCVAERVTFKFIRSAAILKLRNSKYGDRGSSGKFFTVYPGDEAQLERILTGLGDLLDGEHGPTILSDLRWRSGPLYVRYGGFVSRLGRSESGELVHCIEDPEGRLVPDVRGPSFRPPSWVTLPACLADALAARNSATLQGFPFRATKALHFSNGGGVYQATDTRTGGSVLLKEARPLAGLDEDGADAVARLEREHWALERLAGLDCIPAIVDYRKGHEHWFLARDYVEGKPLARELLTRNPLVSDDRTEGAYAAYTAWALKILDQVEQGVDAMHAKGVVFGDLHPNNILVRPDDTISFIDLETASAADAQSAQAIGAPGFRAPAGYTGTAVDRYALGCIRLGVFLPLTVMATWSPAKADQLIGLVAEHFPVPADFADRIREDLGPAPHPGHAQEGDPQPLWTPPTPATWPALRETLAADLLASATPHREDRLFPGDVEQFSLPGGGATFAFGAAGVLWTLAELGFAPAEEHVAWLTDAARRTPGMGPGFYDGLSGIAYALDRLGRAEEAAAVLERIREAPLEDVDHSLFGGLAGIGLTQLHFGNTDEAARIAALLADQAPGGVAGRPRPGLLRGAAGGALLMLRMHEATYDPKYLHLAGELLRYDLAEAGWSEDTSPDGSADAPWKVPFLSFGGAGLGMVVHEVARQLPDPEFVRARDALREVTGPSFALNSGLFHGRAGALLAMRHLHDGSATAEAAVRRHLDRLGWHAVRCDGHLAFFGDHTLRLSADLATGSAGVLLAVEAALGDAGPGLPFLAPGPR
ncbi:class III lanthionine synthetase LanKC [Streptomyces sp. NBC_00091]|uniref:class III lanthionine synthetase LanKC n=1 Tax=Streptomyces sp. NBC_00091 TaxID=2975648 RepID=UPI00225AFB56|nr:class III lanthionine synthetase LanKC [Streptomyces sp. NBC_00091]MCX5376679.1 class III lanthionine synthetase LanKC [Streptomyces sp. NBC_00091]